MNFRDYITESERSDSTWANVLKLFRKFKKFNMSPGDDWSFPKEVLNTIDPKREKEKVKFFQMSDTNVLLIFPYKADQMGYAIYIDNDMTKIIKKGTVPMNSNAIKKIITISQKQPRKRD